MGSDSNQSNPQNSKKRKRVERGKRMTPLKRMVQFPKEFTTQGDDMWCVCCQTVVDYRPCLSLSVISSFTWGADVAVWRNSFPIISIVTHIFFWSRERESWCGQAAFAKNHLKSRKHLKNKRLHDSRVRAPGPGRFLKRVGKQCPGCNNRIVLQ